MTRKDTIIIAVLVNAALLIALFVTAIKREDTPHQEEKIAANTQLIAIPETDKNEIKAAQGDEIDLVLKEFSEKKTEVTAVEDTAKIDFVKELEAITKSVSEMPQEAASTESADFIKVTVKKGDVLEKIARANQSTVDEIIRVNQLKSSMLQIGQTLKIPRKGQTASIAKASIESSGPEYYVVKQGDNPWAIAVKNHLKVDELLKLNNLTEEKARHLKPGDKLRIRK
ncbi:MAG: LysM peptidoglycan-binding domain-containing protein [Verrucomicrobia bacterium]|nr:LysM peptidoglycan-binding domain-containing protein [Verrucomicrobiota bacterium]